MALHAHGSEATRRAVGGKGFRLWGEELTERHGRANFVEDLRPVTTMTQLSDPSSNGINRK